MVTADRLIHELNSLGVNLLVGESSLKHTRKLSPTTILVGLTGQTDARLRMAIIALLLYRPDIAQNIPLALSRLNEKGQLTLKLYYSAAVFLQQIYLDQLQNRIEQYRPLPDLFSQEFQIPSVVNPHDKLYLLSKCHQRLSGLSANWLGTYQHAAKRLISRLEKEVSWTH